MVRRDHFGNFVRQASPCTHWPFLYDFPRKTTPEQQNIDLIKGLYEAFGKGDIDPIMTTLLVTLFGVLMLPDYPFCRRL